MQSDGKSRRHVLQLYTTATEISLPEPHRGLGNTLRVRARTRLSPFRCHALRPFQWQSRGAKLGPRPLLLDSVRSFPHVSRSVLVSYEAHRVHLSIPGGFTRCGLHVLLCATVSTDQSDLQDIRERQDKCCEAGPRECSIAGWLFWLFLMVF